MQKRDRDPCDSRLSTVTLAAFFAAFFPAFFPAFLASCDCDEPFDMNRSPEGGVKKLRLLGGVT